MGMRSQGLVNKKKTLRKSHSFRKKKLLMWSIELLEHRTLVFLEHVSNIWFILKKNMKKKVWLLIFSGDVQRLFIMWFTISPTYMVWGGLIQWIKDSVFTNSLFFFYYNVEKPPPLTQPLNTRPCFEREPAWEINSNTISLLHQWYFFFHKLHLEFLKPPGLI